MEITGILKSWSHRACGTGWKKLAEFGQELVLPQNLPGLTSSYYPRHRLSLPPIRILLLPRIVVHAVQRIHRRYSQRIRNSRFDLEIRGLDGNRLVSEIVSKTARHYQFLVWPVHLDASIGIGNTTRVIGVEYALAWFNDRWIGNYDGFNYIGDRFRYLRAWKIAAVKVSNEDLCYSRLLEKLI